MIVNTNFMNSDVAFKSQLGPSLNIRDNKQNQSALASPIVSLPPRSISKCLQYSQLSVWHTKNTEQIIIAIIVIIINTLRPEIQLRGIAFAGQVWGHLCHINVFLTFKNLAF